MGAQLLLNLSITKKGVLIAVVPLLVNLVFFWSASVLQQQADRIVERETRSAEITGHVNTAQELEYKLGITVIMYTMSRHRAWLRRCETIQKQLHQVVSEVEDLVKAEHDAPQLRNFEKWKKQLAFAQDLADQVTTEGDVGVVLSTREWKDLLTDDKQVFRDSRAITDREHILRRAIPVTGARSRAQVQFITQFGVVGNILMTVLSVTFFRNFIHRIRHILTNVDRMKEDSALDPSTPGTDELAELDSYFVDVATTVRESSRKEKALIDNARDIICSLDSELRFIKVSQASSLLWMDAAEDLIGVSFPLLLSEEDETKIVRIFNACRNETGGEQFSFEHELVRRDGERRWMKWTVFWSLQHQQFFCVVRDVTSEHELQNIKREFANMVSHDIRGPLQSIRLVLDTLETDRNCCELTPTGHILVTRARTSTVRLVKLASDLLDVEKLEELGAQLDRLDTTVETLLYGASDMVSALFDEKQIELVIDCGESIVVHADEMRMMQAIQNILTNAIRFTPVKGKISLSATVVASQVLIYIDDSGPGIPVQYRKRVFERFKQIKATEAKQGIGLGLSITKSIVEQHNGKITADVSPLLGGARFTIELPLVLGVN